MATLPKELSSLLHHVELAEAGWNERALGLLIQCVLRDRPGLGTHALVAELRTRLPGPVTRDRVQAAIRRLREEGAVVEISEDSLKVSEATSMRLAASINQHEELCARVQRRYEELMGDYARSNGLAWTDFERDFLGPLLEELGARTYELVSGIAQATLRGAAFLSFISRAPADVRGTVAESIDKFFDSKDADVRTYVLGRLNAVFLVQATGLPEAALARFRKRQASALDLVVLVDTNFLFSLIGLHENPADDVVDVLRQLISRVRDRVSVRLNVLPSTIDEAKRTVIANKDRLQGIRLTSRTASVVQRGTSDLSGIALKYVSEAAKKGGLSAAEFFEPYIENLLAIARSNGVELHNEKVAQLATDQEVVDDVLAQVERGKKLRGDERAKSYEVVEHDMILWHFAHRRRPAQLESPMDARLWIATLDFSLLGFDRFKMRRLNQSVPLCIHPTVLLHLLQLWVPRSAELDAALLESFRPLVPHIYDQAAELTTLRILRVLSRFENVDDLQEETVTQILFDKAARARIAGSSDVDSGVTAVRDLLIEKYSRIESETEALRGERAHLQKELVETREGSRQLSSQVEELAGRAQSSAEAANSASRELAVERERGDKLTERLTALASEVELLKRVNVASEVKKRVVRTIVATGLISVCVAVGLGFLVRLLLFRSWLVWAACLIAAAFVWTAVSERAARTAGLAAWARVFRRCKKVAAWVLLAALAGIVENSAVGLFH